MGLREHMGAAGWLAAILALGIVLPAAASKATDVSVVQAKTAMEQSAKNPGLVILDVRTPQEFSAGHLRGAVNVDIAAPDFVARLKALDRSKKYLVYCRTGNRSQKAIAAMEQLDFKHVLHMYEGIVGWQKKNYPLVK
jgi:rhodanese-related sulfurtransferase